MTSGYNSDAVSDHEYENIQVVSCRDAHVTKLQRDVLAGKDEGTYETEDEDKTHNEHEDDEEEDNYVILRAVTDNADSGHWVSCDDLT